MAINYNISKCVNPNGVEGANYYSCKARKTSDYSFKELASDISLATTVTKGDAMAVLASIKPFIKNALLAGRRVVLDDLGSFVIGVRSKCFTDVEMAADDFVPSSKIRGYSLHFRPESELKGDIKHAGLINSTHQLKELRKKNSQLTTLCLIINIVDYGRIRLGQVAQSVNRSAHGHRRLDRRSELHVLRRLWLTYSSVYCAA